MRKSTWKDYLGKGQEALAAAKVTYGDNPFYCDATLTSGSEESTDQGSAEGTIDLQNEEVQKAIQLARAQERQQAAQREKGLRDNRDAILAEKKAIEQRLEGLGEPDSIREKLAKLERYETEKSANKAGTDPDKFQAEVERVAQAKFEQARKEQSAVLQAKDEEIAKLKAASEALDVKSHRLFVAQEVLRAAMPEGHRIVQDGAWDYLIDQLAPLVVQNEVPGLGPVARLSVDGVLVPGTGPDGYMTVGEAMTHARQGKGPVPNVGFCFVSNGKGTGTQTPGASKPGAGNWSNMNSEQRANYVRENGAKAAQELIDASAPS